MQTDLISIGNSKGIRIPANIIKQLNIEDKLEMTVDVDKIILKPVNKPRDGWDMEFKKMHENNDDKLIIDDAIDLNVEDWEWN